MLRVRVGRRTEYSKTGRDRYVGYYDEILEWNAVEREMVIIYLWKSVAVGIPRRRVE